MLIFLISTNQTAGQIEATRCRKTTYNTGQPQPIPLSYVLRVFTSFPHLGNSHAVDSLEET
jgi:hypothetical protein